MSEKLPKSVYRDMDYDRWDNFLMQADKEKLLKYVNGGGRSPGF